eukprot:GHRQ01023502.1.p1 GENE.GHRQ01023502.1~~GHRQ01023502.1.p1  ORF type:complete len:315 (+),score=115.53 GHRQ01023502.1:333-1277(+)
MRRNIGVFGSSAQWRGPAYLRHSRAARLVLHNISYAQPAQRLGQQHWSRGVGFRSVAAAAAVRSDTGSNTELDDAAAFAVNMWEPVPPTPALGRKRKVALLLGCAMLEVTLTGTLLWAPLLGAVVLAVLQPTRAEIAARQEAAVEQAVAATEVRMSRQLPVTPVESAAWLNRLMQDMWGTFWQPFLLANNLSMWQDTVAAAAPRGWEVEIADVSIGSIAPELTGFQAFADPASGEVTALECAMTFDSDSVRLVVVGRGPLGAFTARVSAVELKGQLRIMPLLQHRMLLLAFKEQPQVRAGVWSHCVCITSHVLP